ncbi:CRISPR-associated protein Cse2 [Planctomycetes bacterium Pan216]|uniref:CRISPR-associated protein Cse2 n=1 Tax=Kolteria novifilia TaxID=2527975 RepID=A0A518B0F3_9BACT|nr:CRISPR-associated protein Cse2 [Planctomycetes bacterium Pan216]
MKRQTWRDELVESLQRIESEKDRATLARLRRGVGKPFGTLAERDAWVIRRTPSTLSDRDLDVACIIASLFASHSKPGGTGTLGAAFRQLARQDDSDGPERRFTTLLNADAEDLPGRLRHAISLLRSKDIAVDWIQVAKDLFNWSHPDRFVQRQWARDFWSPQSGENESISDKAKPSAVSQ